MVLGLFPFGLGSLSSREVAPPFIDQGKGCLHMASSRRERNIR